MSESAIAYTGLGLDRAGARRRDPAWLGEQRARQDVRLLRFWQDRYAPDSQVVAGQEVFLGLDGEVPVFAVDLPEAADTVDVRSLFGTVPADQAAALVCAKGLLHWNRHQRFCGTCGAATESREGGHLRVCQGPHCGRLLFPRIEPAVIALVEHEDRCLLARHRGAGPTAFATLAGFVEIGEALEEAVRREVAEESGVTVDTVTYLGSQPWPFPSGLMIGFRARAVSGHIAVDHEELEEARWFTREEVLAGGHTGRVDSIGAHLIEQWVKTPGLAPSGA
ncbi:NAD(+) diphosphatase [Kutzneria albida]|uniref:NAD(+) diphosphatase n=1 Tax=Kutzneria albida DSM 43870 TaxID=1449976 RepID=W5WP83_9PSEU|nr:NAD(+) diphosphatase [Kutzneria albida]AHH99994.1 hypothetical protein KALB_6635 [Kutzneria albida DSM 43870]